MIPERAYFHYEELEEYHAGLWRITRGNERVKFREQSAALMKDTEGFKMAMQRASREWTKSCLSNLTADGVNRIAWLGHAGCCIAVGSPEDVTRQAWHTLTISEQDAANIAAALVLDEWLAENLINDLFKWADKNAQESNR